MKSKTFNKILSETPDEIKEFVQKKSEEFKLPKLPKYTGISAKDGSIVEGYFYIEFNHYFIIDKFYNRIGVIPHTVKINKEDEWYSEYNWDLIVRFAEFYKEETGIELKDEVIDDFFNA